MIIYIYILLCRKYLAKLRKHARQIYIFVYKPPQTLFIHYSPILHLFILKNNLPNLCFIFNHLDISRSLLWCPPTSFVAIQDCSNSATTSGFNNNSVYYVKKTQKAQKKPRKLDCVVSCWGFVRAAMAVSIPVAVIKYPLCGR